MRWDAIVSVDWSVNAYALGAGNVCNVCDTDCGAEEECGGRSVGDGCGGSNICNAACQCVLDCGTCGTTDCDPLDGCYSVGATNNRYRDYDDVPKSCGGGVCSAGSCSVYSSGTNVDGDLFDLQCGDCDDTRSNVYPGLTETGRCTDGLNNDCGSGDAGPNYKDYDTLNRGGGAATHGDSDCALSITAVPSVSNSTPYAGGTIDITCPVSAGDINSVYAWVDWDGNGAWSSLEDCAWNLASYWSGNNAVFKDCNVGGSTGSKRVYCDIANRAFPLEPADKSYQTGSPRYTTITVTNDPSACDTLYPNPGDAAACNADANCAWVPECRAANKQYSGGAGRCMSKAAAAGVAYACSVAICHEECDGVFIPNQSVTCDSYCKDAVTLVARVDVTNTCDEASTCTATHNTCTDGASTTNTRNCDSLGASLHLNGTCQDQCTLGGVNDTDGTDSFLSPCALTYPGVCGCDPGWYDCDGNFSNGCESAFACQENCSNNADDNGNGLFDEEDPECWISLGLAPATVYGGQRVVPTVTPLNDSTLYAAGTIYYSLGSCAAPPKALSGAPSGFNVSVNGGASTLTETYYACYPKAGGNSDSANVQVLAGEDCTDGIDNDGIDGADCNDDKCCGTAGCPCYASLTGVIRDEAGAELPGATVSVLTSGGALQNVTNGSGGYVIAGVLPGTHDVVTQKTGYRANVTSTTFGNNALVWHNVTLGDGDCSECLDWEGLCSQACVGSPLCGVDVPAVCEGVAPGEWRSYNSTDYVRCCGEVYKPKVDSAVEPTGCMKDLVTFTRIVRYAGQPVTLTVYTWEPCES